MLCNFTIFVLSQPIIVHEHAEKMKIYVRWKSLINDKLID